jgi:hypothetical protein
VEPLSLLGALLGMVGIVAFVAAPLVRPPAATADSPAGLALVERRDRALAALRELEFDHRTGKVGDEDYGAVLASLRQEAAEALAAVETRT